MASKRRNMFQKNKTQETTENASCFLTPFCVYEMASSQNSYLVQERLAVLEDATTRESRYRKCPLRPFNTQDGWSPSGVDLWVLGENECGSAIDDFVFTESFDSSQAGCNFSIFKNNSEVCGLALTLEGSDCNEGYVEADEDERLCAGSGWKWFGFRGDRVVVRIGGGPASRAVVHGRQVGCGEGLSPLRDDTAECTRVLEGKEFLIRDIKGSERGCSYNVVKNSSLVCSLVLSVDGGSCIDGRVTVGEEKICPGAWERFVFEEDNLSFKLEGPDVSKVIVHGRQADCAEGAGDPSKSCARKVSDKEFTMNYTLGEEGCEYSIVKNGTGFCGVALRLDGLNCDRGYVLLGRQKLCPGSGWKMFDFEGESLQLSVWGKGSYRMDVKQVSCLEEFRSLVALNTTCRQDLGNSDFTIIYTAGDMSCVYGVTKSGSHVCALDIRLEGVNCSQGYVSPVGLDTMICRDDGWKRVEFIGEKLDFRVVGDGVSKIMVHGKQVSCGEGGRSRFVITAILDKCDLKIGHRDFTIQYAPESPKDCEYKILRNSSKVCGLGVRVVGADCSRGYVLVRDGKVCKDDGWKRFEFSGDYLDIRAIAEGASRMVVEGSQVNCDEVATPRLASYTGPDKCRRKLETRVFSIHHRPEREAGCVYEIHRKDSGVCGLAIRVDCKEGQVVIGSENICGSGDWRNFKFNDPTVELIVDGTDSIDISGFQVDCPQKSQPFSLPNGGCLKEVRDAVFNVSHKSEITGNCVYFIEKNSSLICALYLRVKGKSCGDGYATLEGEKICAGDGWKKFNFNSETLEVQVEAREGLEGRQVSCRRTDTNGKILCHKRISDTEFRIRGPCQYTVLRNHSRVCGLGMSVHGEGCALIGNATICEDDGRKSLKFGENSLDVTVEDGTVLEGAQVNCVGELYGRCLRRVSDLNFRLRNFGGGCTYVVARNGSGVCGLVVHNEGDGCMTVGGERVCGGGGPRRVQFAGDEVEVTTPGGAVLVGRQVSCAAAATRARSCCPREQTGGRVVTLASPGGPWDCEMRVPRLGPQFCRLRMTFSYFWVGRGEDGYGCRGGLEVDGYVWCGCQSGLVWTTSRFVFEELTNEAVFRLWDDGLEWQRGHRRGFLLTVEQVECYGPGNGRTFDIPGIPFNLVGRRRFKRDRWDGRCLAGPPRVIDCPRYPQRPEFQGDDPCRLLEAASGTIASPRYPGSYPPYSKHCYRLGEDECGWELYFHDFEFPEDGGQCSRGYLQVDGKRYCGRSLVRKSMKLAKGGELRLSGSGRGGRGYLAKYRRLRCPQPPNGDFDYSYNGNPDYGDYDGNGNDDGYDGNGNDDGYDGNGNNDGGRPGDCSFVFLRERFTIRHGPVRMGASKCLYTVRKSSQDVCGLELNVRDLNLECGKETLYVGGKYYCGILSRDKEIVHEFIIAIPDGVNSFFVPENRGRDFPGGLHNFEMRSATTRDGTGTEVEGRDVGSSISIDSRDRYIRAAEPLQVSFYP
ncbi:hypothetical protein AAG570_001642 [Ranatra chinensis]|uniref:CUB domain-containing protein n=1 Tax=Ranatra chinensis TaxID=642074 RepID=A0ABD0Y9D6_9HEMI